MCTSCIEDPTLEPWQTVLRWQRRRQIRSFVEKSIRYESGMRCTTLPVTTHDKTIAFGDGRVASKMDARSNAAVKILERVDNDKNGESYPPLEVL